MQMKKRIFVCVTLFFAGISLHSFDIGLSVDASLGLLRSASAAEQGESSLNLFNSETVTFWGLRNPADVPVGLSWRAWYRYGLEFIEGEPTYRNTFELDELYMFGSVDLAMFSAAYRVGRFSIQDWNGTVFRHTQDGARLTLSSGLLDLRVFGGYTGLIAGHNSSLFISPIDEQQRGQRYGGSPRAVFGTGVRFPELLPGFTASIEGLAQMDFNHLLVDDADIQVNSQYAGLLLNQSLGRNLSLDLLGNLMFQQRIEEDADQVNTLGYLGRLDVSYINPAFKGFSLGARGWYASGAGHDAELGPFALGRYRSMHVQNVVSVRPVAIGGTFGSRLRASINPFRDSAAIILQEMQTSAHTTIAFRTDESNTVMGQLSPDSDQLYVGTEIGAGVSFRPFPDLGTRLSGGVFLPGAAFENNFIRWQMALDISLSL